MSESFTNPERRRDFIENLLKSKGKFVPEFKPSPEQRTFIEAMKMWTEIENGIARELVKSLKSPADYQPSATQLLLLDAFKSRFNVWGKDKLVFLISAMHSEEMEKRIKQIVEQGRVGENFGKEVW